MAEGSSNGKIHTPPSAQAALDNGEQTQEYASAPALQPAHAYLCPSCGQLVPTQPSDYGLDAGPFVTCPHCGAEFVLPAEDEVETTPEGTDTSAEGQMDAARVHELARVRRASIRSRSWLVVGVVGGVATGGQLIQKTVEAVKAGQALTGRTAAFVVSAVFALLVAIYLGRRAAGISRELARPLLEDPPTPPDFSTLSDGSQHWKNLDKM